MDGAPRAKPVVFLVRDRKISKHEFQMFVLHEPLQFDTTSLVVSGVPLQVSGLPPAQVLDESPALKGLSD